MTLQISLHNRWGTHQRIHPQHRTNSTSRSAIRTPQLCNRILNVKGVSIQLINSAKWKMLLIHTRCSRKECKMHQTFQLKKFHNQSHRNQKWCLPNDIRKTTILLYHQSKIRMSKSPNQLIWKMFCRWANTKEDLARRHWNRLQFSCNKSRCKRRKGNDKQIWSHNWIWDFLTIWWLRKTYHQNRI